MNRTRTTERSRADGRARRIARDWLLDHGIDWVAYERMDPATIAAARVAARNDPKAPMTAMTADIVREHQAKTTYQDTNAKEPQ